MVKRYVFDAAVVVAMSVVLTISEHHHLLAGHHFAALDVIHQIEEEPHTPHRRRHADDI